jgi:hypothetical protein
MAAGQGGAAAAAPGAQGMPAPHAAEPLSPGEDLHAGLADGWLLPPPVARQAVATRSIVCRSFRRDDGLIDIDARFADTRPFAYDNDFRGRCEAGSALHHMQLRVTLDRKRSIVALVSAMPSTPYTSCSGVQPNFQRLVGLSMGRGFKRALREQLAGTEGCTHVAALLEVMAAAAVQAFASDFYRPRDAGEAQPVRVWKLDELVNTCWSYHPDGVVMQQMAARAARAQSG